MSDLNEAAVRAMMQKIVEVAEQDADKLLRCQKNAVQNDAAASQDVIGALSQELHYVQPWQPTTPKQPSKLSKLIAKLQHREQTDTLTR